MASSGVSVDPSCQEVYQQLKLGKKLKYIIFALNAANTSIIVEKQSDSTKYDEFLSDLPEDSCRWAVYDLEYEKEDGGKRNKLCFVTWSPEDAKIKTKMVYASSKEALRRALVGIAVEIQATDFSEVAYESVMDKASRGH